MTHKLLDVQWVEPVQTAVRLARLCYPVAVSIEEKQPATALKLMHAVLEARRVLDDLTTPFGRSAKARPRKVHRALAATKCARAVLKRLAQEDAREAARISAAIEVADRLIEMVSG